LACSFFDPALHRDPGISKQAREYTRGLHGRDRHTKRAGLVASVNRREVVKPPMTQIRVIVVSPEDADDGVAEIWCGDELMAVTVVGQ
jgi:hypothetical protein